MKFILIQYSTVTLKMCENKSKINAHHLFITYWNTLCPKCTDYTSVYNSKPVGWDYDKFYKGFCMSNEKRGGGTDNLCDAEAHLCNHCWHGTE